MNVAQEVRQMVAGIIGRKAEQIEEEASFTNDLGVDSLMVLEILAAIENKYHVEIPPERLAEMITLKGVIRVAQESIGGGQRDAQG